MYQLRIQRRVQSILLLIAVVAPLFVAASYDEEAVATMLRRLRSISLPTMSDTRHVQEVTSTPTMTPAIQKVTSTPTITPLLKKGTSNPTMTPAVQKVTSTPTITPLVKKGTSTPTMTPAVQKVTFTPTMTPVIQKVTSTPTMTPVAAKVTFTFTPTMIPVVAKVTSTPTPTMTPLVQKVTSTPTMTAVAAKDTSIPTMIPVVAKVTSTPTLTPVVQKVTSTPTMTPILPPLTLPTMAPTMALFSLRINAGSAEDYIDANGKVWKSDRIYTDSGDIYSLCPLEIVNTTLDALYCKERYFNKWVHNKPFKYEIPVPKIDGAYEVKLHFAEINYKSANERVFDVWINGKLAIRSLDVYDEVGFATALVIPIITRITTSMSQISIEFVSKIENPKICAIEILEITDYIAPPTAAPAIPKYTKYISAGATENWYDEATSITWEKDQYFGNKGAVHSICPAQINGTDTDSLYCKDRYFNKWEVAAPYRYDIPVPTDGIYYSVKLHFAEFYYQIARARMFDVLVNGRVVRRNLDIYGEAGYRTAYVLPVVTFVNNGTILIEFVSKVENPKICAIEIMELLNYVPPPTEAPIEQPFSTRISAGATKDWIDNNGVEWAKDKYYNNKGGVHWVCPQSINGTDLDSLYCKDRYFNKWEYSGPFRYDIPVPKDAAYSVNLHFAEVAYQVVGARVFDVLVNGKMVFKNLDIYKEAGYLNAFILPVVTFSNNATISIEFISNKENPKVCAIEVIEIPNYIPPPTAAPTPPPRLPFATRISAGATEDWIDDNGITWEMDKYFDGKGEIFKNCPLAIAGTNQDSLYCKERYFNKWKYEAPFRYEIPVPRIGAYSLRLHFAEITYQSRGERIFDVLVGGKVVLGSLDIFAEAGYANAFVLPTIAQTSTGFITIQLVPKVEHPKICAIEVVELPDYVAPPTAAPVVRPFEILINSGAVDDFVERSTGRVWTKDQYFIGGGVLFKRHFDIIGTTNDEVFHIERHGEFRYEIPVPPGRYELILHFTELHFDKVGKRLFDVTIENSISFKRLDLVKMSGRIRSAFTINHTLPVTDGLLSIQFSNSNPQVDMPKVSGVEVRFLSTSTEPVNNFPILINCGGNDFIERNGATSRQWISDRNFINGNPYNNSKDSKTRAIANQIYHTGRHGALRYEIPVPVGRYEVKLHFAETGLSGVGTRLFDVVIEDAITYKNVDVVKLGNGQNFKPIIVTSQVNVIDGLLTVVFAFASPPKNSPMISGIEINVIGNGPIAAPTNSPVRAPVFLPIKAPTVVTSPTASLPQNCTIPKITPDSWATPFAPYPINVAEPAGSMIGNDFVLFSGFKNGYNNATTETYSLDMSLPNVEWVRMDDMPFAQGITHQGLVVIGMKAYLCGGYIGGSLGKHTDRCFVYDHSKPTGQQWSSFTPLPNGGRSGGAMIFDSTLNAIVYAGGSQRATQGHPVAIDYKDTWMYSLDNPSAGWVQQSKMPFYGNHMNSITILDSLGKERHYVFGGQVGDYELWGNTATMYEYVPITDQWIQRTSMPFERGHSTAAVRAVGCGFIVAGGRTNKGLTGDITYYSPSDDTWQSIGRLPVDIHTNVCVVAYGKLRCEAGWATGTFSTETTIQF